MPLALDDATWPLRSERLLIRRATPSDADVIWSYRRLEPISRHMTALPADRDAFAALFVESDRLAATLAAEREAEVVGDLKLEIQDAWAQAEIADQAKGTQAELGWVLAPWQQGNGYATEAVIELQRLCFEELGLRRAEAFCFADNTASWRLMDRVGMRREIHSVAESLHRTGEWMDGLGYAMLSSEWPQA